MYEGKRLFISVGALQVQGIRNKLKAGFTVIAYEPERDAFMRYQEIEDPHLICHDKAVSDVEGRTTLWADRGNSTILDSQSNGGYSDSYEVDVVTLDSILKPVKNVHGLYLNCEGSEIPIIMGTSLDNFVKCKRIYVEFHKFVKRLCITDKMIETCVQKLGQRFTVKDRHTYHPYYEFLRKE